MGYNVNFEVTTLAIERNSYSSVNISCSYTGLSTIPDAGTVSFSVSPNGYIGNIELTYIDSTNAKYAGGGKFTFTYKIYALNNLYDGIKITATWKGLNSSQDLYVVINDPSSTTSSPSSYSIEYDHTGIGYQVYKYNTSSSPFFDNFTNYDNGFSDGMKWSTNNSGSFYFSTFPGYVNSIIKVIAKINTNFSCTVTSDAVANVSSLSDVTSSYAHSYDKPILSTNSGYNTSISDKEVLSASASGERDIVFYIHLEKLSLNIISDEKYLFCAINIGDESKIAMKMIFKIKLYNAAYFYLKLQYINSYQNLSDYICFEIADTGGTCDMLLNTGITFNTSQSPATTSYTYNGNAYKTTTSKINWQYDSAGSPYKKYIPYKYTYSTTTITQDIYNNIQYLLTDSILLTYENNVNTDDSYSFTIENFYNGLLNYEDLNTYKTYIDNVLENTDLCDNYTLLFVSYTTLENGKGDSTMVDTTFLINVLDTGDGNITVTKTSLTTNCSIDFNSGAYVVSNTNASITISKSSITSVKLKYDTTEIYTVDTSKFNFSSLPSTYTLNTSASKYNISLTITYDNGSGGATWLVQSGCIKIIDNTAAAGENDDITSNYISKIDVIPSMGDTNTSSTILVKIILPFIPNSIVNIGYDSDGNYDDIQKLLYFINSEQYLFTPIFEISSPTTTTTTTKTTSTSTTSTTSSTTTAISYTTWTIQWRSTKSTCTVEGVTYTVSTGSVLNSIRVPSTISGFSYASEVKNNTVTITLSNGDYSLGIGTVLCLGESGQTTYHPKIEGITISKPYITVTYNAPY